MIRFVDLTAFYWVTTEPPERSPRICAFLNTTSDRFLKNQDGTQIFTRLDVAEHPERARLERLVPPGFFGDEE